MTGSAGTPIVLAKPVPEGPRRQHSAAVWGDSRWLIVREEPGELEPDVFLDDVRVFTSAWAPRIAESGGTVLIAAIRNREIVARAFESGAPFATDERPPVALSPLHEFHDAIPELSAEQVAGHDAGYEGVVVAAAGGKALIAWTINFRATSEVRFRIVSESGVTDEIVLDATDSTHYLRGAPAVAASNGTDFLVGWLSWEATDAYRPKLKLARISGDGVVRDPGGIVVGSGAEMAALVWHRDHWLTVWTHGSAVSAQRLAPDGTLLDASPIYLGAAYLSTYVQAVSNGRTALVTWSTNPFGAVLFDEGSGFHAISPITPVFSGLAAVASATDGENYLLAYSCYFECRAGDARSAVYQTRLWSIEIDGVSGNPVEPAPQPVSRLLQHWSNEGASIAHSSDWWVLRMETTDPYANRPVSDVYLGDERIFENASSPVIAHDGSFVVVAAWRAPEVVYRIGRVRE